MKSQVSIAISVTLLAGTLAACQQAPETTQPTKTVVKTEIQVDPELLKDPEMAKKIAEAKARFAAMSPQERAKFAQAAKAVATTLPMTLADASAIPVTPSGASPTTLGKIAPVGVPTIVAAWASWCVPCRIEAKQLAEARRNHGKDALNIVYLNIGDPKVEATKGPQFLKDAGAEALGLTMLSEADFKTLTKVPQVSIPRVLPYDRAGLPKTPISGAAVVIGSENKRAPNRSGDPRIWSAIDEITA